MEFVDNNLKYEPIWYQCLHATVMIPLVPIWSFLIPAAFLLFLPLYGLVYCFRFCFKHARELRKPRNLRECFCMGGLTLIIILLWFLRYYVGIVMGFLLKYTFIVTYGSVFIAMILSSAYHTIIFWYFSVKFFLKFAYTILTL